MKSQLLWEFATPALSGVALHYLSRFFKCPEERECTFVQLQSLMIAQVLLMPLFMSLYVPNVTSIAARFILQSIVEDKQTKMRETLRLMSLSQFSYALSYLIFQGFFAVTSGSIVGYCLYGNENVFPLETEYRSR
jgi:ABC-type Na+ efflux pump permease subunit